MPYEKKELLWNEIDWDRIETRIDAIQKRIYKASLSGNKGGIIFLQNLLISSQGAKLLAVRRVTTENKGKNTAGIDGRVYLTPDEKMKLAEKITIDGSAFPIRRVWIPKPGRAEKRPLGIPIIRDRAKQKLVLMALEPEWEALFEPNSYGFRPGRSAQDAVESIFVRLRNGAGKGLCHKYIFDADLKACFDTIDHDFLISKLKTSPKIRNQVKAWLKAGIFDGMNTTPPQSSSLPENQIETPQGGVLSRFLANVALHGMETFLKEWIIQQKWVNHNGRRRVGKQALASSIGIIRYADDFVVIHENYDIITKAKDALSDWLSKTSKLQLNNIKTQIVDSRNGFDFLGFRFINIVRNGVTRVKIYPSKKNQKSLISAIGDRCRKFRSISTYNLIESLRPKMLGWAYYFRYAECQKVFSKLDHMIFNILRAWVFRRDKRNGRRIVKENYFPSGKVYMFDGRPYQDNWVLCGKTKGKGDTIKQNWLPRLSWISSTKFVKIPGNKSVYDGDDVYWSLRTSEYGSFNTRERNLLKKQKGACTYCNKKLKDNIVEIDHIIPKSAGGKDNYSNWQLFHKHCHIRKSQKDLADFKNINQEPDEAKVSCPDL